MLVPRWRSVFVLKTPFIPSLSRPTMSAHIASLHSTSSTCEKRNNKSDSDVGKFNQSSKTYARYIVRQKRSDAKKALKDLLYRTGCTKTPLKEADRLWSLNAEQSNRNEKKKKKKVRSFSQLGNKSQQKKMQRKPKKDSFDEDFDEPEKVFRATFGNKWYTWSFNGSSFKHSTSGFEWREQSKWENFRTTQEHSRSETEFQDESCSVVSYADRRILGLPPSGPLKIEDVKTAFRTSALKWHPDKNQGPSQATAEEKFKLCVNAYKSLCGALSGT